MCHSVSETKMNDEFMKACTRIEEMVDAVNELAVKVTADYPDIEYQNFWTQLTAIDQSFEGLELANKDMHKLCGHLQAQLGLTNEEVLSQWEKIKDE